jgi:hypothetical protein
MSCDHSARNLKTCNCTYPGCPRHGVCCECLAYHRSAGELTACYFSAAEERTYNRSVSFYVQKHGR